MKTLAFFISTSLLLFSSLINVVIAQGINTSCGSFYLSGSSLEYTCSNDKDQSNSSEIDLNLCISNKNGYLFESAKLVYPNTADNAALVRYILKDIPIYSGQYSGTCSDCTLDVNDYGVYLKCDCLDPSGNQIPSNLNLGPFFNILEFP